MFFVFVYMKVFKKNENKVKKNKLPEPGSYAEFIKAIKDAKDLRNELK